MSYPTLEQYNEAFQYPQLALSDHELKQGSIATTGLGLPLALCGGFALTYTIKSTTKKYAVRCFHKQSNALEKRYSSISTRLQNIGSPYFVNFEFQPQGVRVGGKLFPIVKMAWASGTTLGEFLDQNYRNPSNLHNLVTSLRALATYLESQGMAHGDIQPGNVMVADAGKKLQLIDYDGMFVDELRSLGSAELGHRNFQHPKRSSSSWDASLDRFSFIGLDLALRVLASHPELWAKTRSDGDSILFKANDFADPSQSDIFRNIIGQNGFSEEAKNFAAICRSTFDRIPTLDDFLAKRSIPHTQSLIANKSSTTQIQYLSAFPILDAANYALCLNFVGDKVELIGQITEVKQDKTRYGSPYVFINFGSWKGHITKINIWSEGLNTLTNKPNQTWVGQWISVVGLMEPPYVNKRYKYSHLSISITQGNQFHLVTEKEAKFRLAGSATRSPALNPKTPNQEILVDIKRISTSKTISSNNTNSQIPANSITSNQAVLNRIHNSQPALPSKTSPPTDSYQSEPLTRQKIHNSQPAPSLKIPPSTGFYQSKPRTKPPTSSSNCFIATALYGVDALETHALRQWRDKYLLPYRSGRLFVSIYYAVSPVLVSVLNRSKLLRKVIKSILDKFVIHITSDRR